MTTPDSTVVLSFREWSAMTRRLGFLEGVWMALDEVLDDEVAERINKRLEELRVTFETEDKSP